jgi:hypothetical protein
VAAREAALQSVTAADFKDITKWSERIRPDLMILAAYGLHAFPPAALRAETTVLQLDASYNRANREVLITGSDFVPIEVGILCYIISSLR